VQITVPDEPVPTQISAIPATPAAKAAPAEPTPTAVSRRPMDAIAVRGVSSIYPLGQCEQVFPGFPQDGMFVLSELVDWKNG